MSQSKKQPAPGRIPREQAFHEVSEYTHDLVVIIEKSGTILYNNTTVTDIVGKKRLQANTSFVSLLRPADRPKASLVIESIFINPIADNFTVPIVDVSGNERIVEFRSIVSQPGHQTDDYRILVGRDITQQSRIEKELHLLETAVNSTQDAFCLNDLDNNFLLVNPAFCELYGYRADELIGKNIEIVRSQKISTSMVRKIKDETLRGGWTGEVYNLKRDGTEFPVELRTAVVRDVRGEPIAFVGIGRDLTERRKAEEQLYKTTSRLDLMLDNLNIVAYEFDTEGRFLLSRGKGLEQLGLKPNEVVGKSMFDLYKNYPPLVQALPKALAGAPQTLEVEVEGVIWYTNFIPVKNSQGKIDRVFGLSIDVTERKKAEEALRYESELWHTLMNNIPDTIYFKDRDLRFTRINKAQAEILGIPDTKEAIGKRDGDFFSSENAVQQMADERQIITTGIPLLGKVEKVITKGDKTHWFSTTKVPFRSQEGDIVGIVGSSREITELKQAEILESALYRIAEKTSSSSDMHNFYSSIHAIIGELMYANNFYIALYDQEKDLLSFPYFVDEYDPSPSSRPLGHGLTEYVLRTGKSLLADEKRSDELYRSGDAILLGAPSPVWLGVPLVGEKKTIGVMVVQHYSDSRTFTKREQHILEFVSSQVAKAIEHKRAEEALRASEAELVALFNSMNDTVIVLDTDGRFLKIGTTNEKLLFKPIEYLLGKKIHEVFPKETADRFLSAILQAVSQPNPVNIEYDLEIGQRTVWFSGVVSRMNDRSVVWVARDITERKRLEEQLRQSQKMEGIGTLAGGIAHDFNNLLGIILGYATILESPNIEVERRLQSVETIKRAVQRGADLVRQLLTFARKSEPTFGLVNINDLIEELGKMLSQTFPRTIDIRLRLEKSVPSITADATQIHQALLNLCLNSRDAMIDQNEENPKKGTLTISSSLISSKQMKEKFPDAENNDFLAVQVADTGIGMDENTRKRIFEPFFTTKELGKGTGLGLAVVYGIIKSHQALVEVESTENIGTSFSLYFPVPLHGENPADVRTVFRTTGNQQKKTILVVEDEEMLLLLLQSILEDEGYRVMTAKDGQEAVELYKNHTEEISLILSDMGLPRLGGWEMFQEMKKINPHVKAILASGYFEPNLKIELINAGAKDFIKKPYVAAVILQRIQEVIDAN